jgi:hypothetical protein
MVVFQCATQTNITVGVPYVCQGMATGCTTPLLLWARGTGPTFLPSEVGLPIGTADSPRFTMIQIHYNNPEAVAGLRDSSGFRYRQTKKKEDREKELIVL